MLVWILAILLSPLVASADVLVSWTPNTEADLEGYTIQRATDCTASFATVADIGLSTTYRHLGATNGAYRVLARDTSKNVSLPSGCVVAQATVPPPTTPPTSNTITDLRVIGITAQSATITATVPPGKKILIRVAPSPINWGATPDQVCQTTPCLVTGLSPLRTYQAQAVLYTGVLGSATFDPISSPTTFVTPNGPVTPPPPPEPPPPTGSSVFKNIQAGNWTMTLQYTDSDCPKGTRRTIKGTTTKTITITCLR